MIHHDTLLSSYTIINCYHHAPSHTAITIHHDTRLSPYTMIHDYHHTPWYTSITIHHDTRQSPYTPWYTAIIIHHDTLLSSYTMIHCYHHASWYTAIIIHHYTRLSSCIHNHRVSREGTEDSEINPYMPKICFQMKVSWLPRFWSVVNMFHTHFG